MKADIYEYKQYISNGQFAHDLIPTYLGYAEVEKFNAEEIWHLCNWSHWSEESPSNLHVAICSCNHGLCLINPETQERWLAKSIDWLVGDEKTNNQSVYIRQQIQHHMAIENKK